MWQDILQHRGAIVPVLAFFALYFFADWICARADRPKEKSRP